MGAAEDGIHRPENEGCGRLECSELIVACALYLKKEPNEILDHYSPALCEKIYRTHQREALREKLTDLRIADTVMAHFWGKDCENIVGELRQEIRELIAPAEETPNDNG